MGVCKRPRVLRVTRRPKVQIEGGVLPTIGRWQDLIPDDFESSQRTSSHSNVVPIPAVCPVCGPSVTPYHRWDTARRLGWTVPRADPVTS